MQQGMPIKADKTGLDVRQIKKHFCSFVNACVIAIPRIESILSNEGRRCGVQKAPVRASPGDLLGRVSRLAGGAPLQRSTPLGLIKTRAEKGLAEAKPERGIARARDERVFLLRKNNENKNNCCRFFHVGCYCIVLGSAAGRAGALRLCKSHFSPRLPVHALRLLVTAWFQGLAAVSMSSPGAFMKHPG